MILEIVAIVTPAIAIVSIAGIISDHKAQRMKIEAALREEEMRRGYMPGTYSRSFSSKKAYKQMKKENKKAYKNASESFKQKGTFEEDMDKEDLERAISDLEKRINNLDTIMKERKK